MMAEFKDQETRFITEGTDLFWDDTGERIGEEEEEEEEES